MKKKKLRITVIKEEKGYSATTEIDDYFIGTEAESFEELKEHIVEAVNLAFEDVGIEYKQDDIRGYISDSVLNYNISKEEYGS